MDIDMKAELNALEKLRNGAWEEFNNRRIYEWKMSMGVWTALAAFIALILTGRVKIPFHFSIYAWIVIVSIFFLHAYFSYNLAISNRTDRKKQFFFENKINNILKVSYDDELQKDIATAQKRGKRCPLVDWSQFVQLSVTLILLLIAYSVVFLLDSGLNLSTLIGEGRGNPMCLYLNPKAVNSIGLLFDIIGIIILVKDQWRAEQKIAVGTSYETDQKVIEDNKKWFRIGVIFVLSGFIFQLISNWLK